MVTLETLNEWLIASSENENLEFKEAKQKFKSDDLMRYAVAIANEGGGYLVLGITDKKPRYVIGSKAFIDELDMSATKARVVEKLNIRLNVTELNHLDGRVLVFEIPSRLSINIQKLTPNQLPIVST